MDEPASKRRKTSPPEGAERTPSPLKKPPIRPSFASPTKASLARFNPGLLPRPTDATREEALARGQQARAYILGETAGQRDGDEAREQTERRQEDTVAGAEQGGRNVASTTTTPRAQRTAARGPAEEGEEEEDLPITPSTRALALQDTPRRGILFSSPSKRPPRRKEGAPVAPVPPDQPADALPNQDRAASTRPAPQAEGGAEPPNDEPEPLSLLKKKRERDRLLREIASLEKDVEQYTDLIKKEANRGPNDKLTPKDLDTLIDAILKADPSETQQEKAPTLLSLLASFIPFSKPVAQPHKTGSDKPVPSHRPLSLDDPLPYLEMFTDFKYTSTMTLPSSDSARDLDPGLTNLLQTHHIQLTGPSKLLCGNLSMTINTPALEITTLEIGRVSPWAEHELGTYIRARAQEKDVGVVCWAMNSYWPLARKRAECWVRCEEEFKHLLPSRSHDKDSGEVDSGAESETPSGGITTALLSYKRRLRKTGKGRARSEDRPGDTEEDTEGEGASPNQVSRKMLRKYLGQDAFVVRSKSIYLRIGWAIEFGWTGEAESSVKATAAFPKVWNEADRNNAFQKIPETFDMLVRERGVFEAARVMVALLFGTADGEGLP